MVENALASMVLPLQGGHSMIRLCQPAAAISKALFAFSWPIIYLKSPMFFVCQFGISCREIGAWACKGQFQFNISAISLRDSIAMISIQGMIAASIALGFGTKILLYQSSLAHIVIGRIEETALSFQSSASSQTNRESFINGVLSIHQSFWRIHIAIGRSKLGHDFFMFAGARLTVILLLESFILLDFIALRSRSLLSWTHWSGNHTMVKAGSQLLISTSVSMTVDSSQFIDNEWIWEIIGGKILVISIYTLYIFMKK